jgi:hypothetical protein
MPAGNVKLTRSSAPAVPHAAPIKNSALDSLPQLETRAIVRSAEESSGNEGSVSEDRKLELMRFKKTFDENIRNKPVHHDKVHVLLLSWEDGLDDLRVKGEVSSVQVPSEYKLTPVFRSLNWKNFSRQSMAFRSPISA